MSKGFLVVAENNNNVDYIKMAYVLALSLKATQPINNKLSIITTEPRSSILDIYANEFDEIIICEKDDKWKEKSKSIDTTSLCASYYKHTPYNETIVLDTDMIFTQDISLWWSILKDKELVFTTNVKTFRGDNAKGDYYRKVFTDNSLPNIYTGLFYFKKGDLSKSYFEMVNTIFNNWEMFFDQLKGDHKPTFLNADLAYSIAYKLLALPDYSYLKVPTFTHMKSQLQDIGNVKEEWTKFLNVFVNENLDIKINNYSQLYPLHYHDKNFLSKEIIKSYEICRI
jgi:hypothetical protein